MGAPDLKWKDLTKEEQAKVIASEMLADDPADYEYYRLAGEIYVAEDEHFYVLEVPVEHEDKYPELFADQDVGCQDPACITKVCLTPISAESLDESLLWSEYFQIEQKHVSDISIVG